MMTPEIARERVARGAAHLDKVRPGWAHEIDVGRLQLHDPCNCIVGQLANDRTFFWDKLRALDMGMAMPMAYDPRSIEMGVEIDQQTFCECLRKGTPNAGYKLLQDAWIEAIAYRLIQDGAVEEIEVVVTT